jgi:hypothetical protein
MSVPTTHNRCIGSRPLTVYRGEAMSEETKPDQEEETTPTISNKDIRASEVFKAATGNVQAKADAAQAELAALKASIADKAKTDRDDALKSQGNWETLETELRAEIAAFTSAHASELLKRDLSLALTQNFSDPYFVQAKVAGYSEGAENITAYVAQLVSDEGNARYLSGYVPPPTSARPPVGSTPSSRPTGTALKDRLTSSDPAVKKAAVSERFQGLLSGELED